MTQNPWKSNKSVHIIQNMTYDEIAQKFGGKVIGNNRIKHFVYETLTAFPDDVAQFITDTCWFMGSFDDAYAFAFTGNDLQDQHLIFLSDDLLRQNNNQIHFTIAHEIGHIMLGHKNSVQYKQSTKEISEQEQQADAFANSYGFFV